MAQYKNRELLSSHPNGNSQTIYHTVVVDEYKRMAQQYKNRLLIPLSGNPQTTFHTTSGLVVACGYERIVIGKRGPYIEFTDEQIRRGVIFVPESEKYRLTSDRVYYHEWRTNEDYVKLYYQCKTVTYADYRIGFWYISPFDLLVDHKEIIKPLRPDKDLFA